MNRTIVRPAMLPGASKRPRRAGAVVFSAGFFLIVLAACTEGREAQDPSQQPPYDPNNPYAQQQGQNAYGQQGAPYPQQGAQYPQQGAQYPQQGAQYPQQGGQYPPATAPATTAQPPSPLALPCQNDLVCGTHKCNLQTQRCAFPCSANPDCAAGFSCFGAGSPTALCVPGAGQ